LAVIKETVPQGEASFMNMLLVMGFGSAALLALSVLAILIYIEVELRYLERLSVERPLRG
jgi:hypothetical protein